MAPRFGSFEVFDVFVGQLNGANQRFALAQSMTIRPAGDQKTELLRQTDVVLADGRCVLGVKTLQAVQPCADQGGDDFIGAIQTRMSHHREAIRLMNQFDRLQRGHLELGHPGRTGLFQEPFESFVQVCAKAAHHERARHVRATRGTAVGDGKNSVGLERVVVDTYQAVSGTGGDAIAEFEGQIRAHVSGQPKQATVYPHPIGQTRVNSYFTPPLTKLLAYSPY